MKTGDRSAMELMGAGLKTFIKQKGDNVDKQTKQLVKSIYHVVIDKKERVSHENLGI